VASLTRAHVGRESAVKTTLPLVKDGGFTCFGTHIGSADFRQACFRKTERKTQHQLERMRPLTDNKETTNYMPSCSPGPQHHIQIHTLPTHIPP